MNQTEHDDTAETKSAPKATASIDNLEAKRAAEVIQVSDQNI
jgi:hypothetical protein